MEPGPAWDECHGDGSVHRHALHLLRGHEPDAWLGAQEPRPGGHHHGDVRIAHRPVGVHWHRNRCTPRVPAQLRGHAARGPLGRALLLVGPRGRGADARAGAAVGRCPARRPLQYAAAPTEHPDHLARVRVADLPTPRPAQARSSLGTSTRSKRASSASSCAEWASPTGWDSRRPHW